MSELYITGLQKYTHQTVDLKKPRESYITFYKDLYKQYDAVIDNETFFEGGKLNFSELGEFVLMPCYSLGWLDNLDLFISTYWSHEYDTVYCSCGPYLAERFKFNCNMFDVIEHANFSIFVSIHLLKKYFHCMNYKKAVLLPLEQTTVPRNKKDCAVMPEQNGGWAVLFESEINRMSDTEQKGVRIIDATIMDAAELCGDDNKMVESILKLLLQHDILHSEVTISFRKNNWIWKCIKRNRNNSKAKWSLFNFDFFDPQPSLLSVFDYLQKLICEDKNNIAPFFLIIDEDIECLNIGFLLFEKM